MIENFLEGFVAARFWLAPVFLIIYYTQLYLERHLLLRAICLVGLLGTLCIAILANYLWIVDYRNRLINGIRFLLSHSRPSLAASQALEQVRWANAKILAVIVMILSVCSQFSRLSAVPSVHQVPVLAVVLLIFVALFDAALDLEAEWTISLLISSRMCGAPSPRPAGTPAATGAVNLAAAIWHTNQFREKQIQMFNEIRGGRIPAIGLASFSSTAQNLLSFAALIVTCTIANDDRPTPATVQRVVLYYQESA